VRCTISSMMPKRLAILTILLAVTQAPMPVPGQAAKSGAQDTRDEQQTSSQKPPSPPTTVVVTPPDTLEKKLDSNQHGDPNQIQTVSVRELPTVSVSKGLEDWLLWAAQIILAIAGLFGIRYAYRTLKSIERQTNLVRMRRLPPSSMLRPSSMRNGRG